MKFLAGTIIPDILPFFTTKLRDTGSSMAVMVKDRADLAAASALSLPAIYQISK